MTDIKEDGRGAGHSPAGPEAIKAIPVRHYGRYVSAVVALALLVAIVYAFSQGRINWGAIPDYFFDDRVVEGHGQDAPADGPVDGDRHRRRHRPGGDAPVERTR